MANSLFRSLPLHRRRPSLIALVLNALAVQRQRRKLFDLSAAQLKDIGRSRAEADLEARRRIWDAPVHWLR